MTVPINKTGQGWAQNKENWFYLYVDLKKFVFKLILEVIYRFRIFNCCR